MKIKKLDKHTMLRLVRAGALATQLPISMALCVIIGVLMGTYFDRYCGTAHWGVAFFSACGVAAGVKSVMRIIRDLEKLTDEKDNPK